MLVNVPASKWPSFPASGGAPGAPSAPSPSPQVPEEPEPEFSLVSVLEVVAFLVGLVAFLGLEALQVVSVPAGLGVGVSWRRPRGEASPAVVSLQGLGLPLLLLRRRLQRQLNMVSTLRGGRPGTLACPQALGACPGH